MEIDELIKRLIKMQRSNICRIYAGERVVGTFEASSVGKVASKLDLKYCIWSQGAESQISE
jgi:hypothetical protein